MENTEEPQLPIEGQEISFDQITKECLDAPGYVFFAGIVSRNRNEKGFNLINFHYRRYHMSFEDVKKSVDEFQKAFVRDVQERG